MTHPGQKLDHIEVLENLRYLLQNDQDDFVRNILADLHAADIADLIERLDSNDRERIFRMLNAEVASEVLTELEDIPKEAVLGNLDSAKIAELVNEMDSDDATDVMDVVIEFSRDKANEVLAKVGEAYSEDIQELLHYPEDSAGGIMAKEYIAVNANDFVEAAIEELRQKADDIDDIYHCYAVDDDEKLAGYITLKDLILARPYSLVKQIMNTDVYGIDSLLDQEEVAQIFERYNLVSAPVVNQLGQLIGRITIDDVVDVIYEETEEDLGRIAGTGEEEIMDEGVFRIARARLPWLIISFFGEIVSAFIMNAYSMTISQIIASAFFIPVVMAMGGSSGQQSSIIVVRGLATGDINQRDLGRRIFREVRTALVTGSVIALLIFTVIYLWQQNIQFALVLAGTLMIVVMNASLFGTVIPFGFKKADIDPALATGPFVATFNDVIGLLIYFSLLSASLKYLMVG